MGDEEDVATAPFDSTPDTIAVASFGVMTKDSVSDGRRVERGGAGTRKAP